MQQQTVIEGVAAWFGMTPLQFSVFFGLGFAVVIIGIVVAVIRLSANVPAPEGQSMAPGLKSSHRRGQLTRRGA